MSLGLIEIEMDHLEDAKNSFLLIDQLSESWKVTVPDLTLLHALSLLHCAVCFQMRKSFIETVMFKEKAKSIKNDIHKVVNYIVFSILKSFFFGYLYY